VGSRDAYGNIPTVKQQVVSRGSQNEKIQYPTPSERVRSPTKREFLGEIPKFGELPNYGEIPKAEQLPKAKISSKTSKPYASFPKIQ